LTASAQIDDVHVGEYRQALTQIEQKYITGPHVPAQDGADPDKMLSDLARCQRRRLGM